jgi:hypothetical protein
VGVSGSEATIIDMSEETISVKKKKKKGIGRTALASEVSSTTRVLSLRPSSCTPRGSGELAPSLLPVSNPLFHARSPSNPGAPLAGTKGNAAKGDPCVMSPRVCPRPAGGSVEGGGPR